MLLCCSLAFSPSASLILPLSLYLSPSPSIFLSLSLSPSHHEWMVYRCEDFPSEDDVTLPLSGRLATLYSTAKSCSYSGCNHDNSHNFYTPIDCESLCIQYYSMQYTLYSRGCLKITDFFAGGVIGSLYIRQHCC